jgi:hypothetical protein
MDQPTVYAVNVRFWLQELARRLARPVNLQSVPNAEVAAWKALGVSHVWLIGVWEVGARSQAVAQQDAEILKYGAEHLEGFGPAEIWGSPYALRRYGVEARLGGDTGLAIFRDQLHRQGLQLILDFIPNHTGLDHVWLRDHPDRYLHSNARQENTFPVPAEDRTLWVAHGKDPYFPPWKDTAQLDHRRREVQQALQSELASVAARCDGVRCDLAMLVLQEVFQRTWQGWPGEPAEGVTEFWPPAIAAIKTTRPDFLFLAEVYWDLEPRLQELGFDYTYDKRLYDLLLDRDSEGVQHHVLGNLRSFVDHSAHFLENHDEVRIATRLSLAEHRAASLLTLGVPGLRLLHYGQLEGARIHARIHACRRPEEPVDPEIAAWYQTLLRALGDSAVGKGEARILKPREAWAGNESWRHFVLVEWQTRLPDFDLVAVNLAPHRSQCYAPLEAPDLNRHIWRMADRLGTEAHERHGDDLQCQGLYLDLPAHGAQLFHFQPR